MVMGVGLYTVRAILDLLGVVDFGIYNVVGGFVAMFSFWNGTLATSSQRYFSINLAKGDLKRLNEWFCLNISAYSIFILVFILIMETVGLWFVNSQMTIPEERMAAANVVYQLSIVSFCVNLISIPYNALIISYERMSAFAYISIVEALLKLAIVGLLAVITWDKLVVYGILMLLASCAISISYIIYCRMRFPVSKYRFYWEKSGLYEMLGFSGWHLFGTLSVAFRYQGINILLNLFFNPAVNAARAVAYQIHNAILQFSDNFFTAVKPQIYKSYASSDFSGLYKLILRSTAMCSFLVSVLVFPVILNSNYILGLWLKEVPEYTVLFTRLALINALIDSISGPTIAPALATGRIKKFQLFVSSIALLNLPISYFALKFGATPEITMIVSIVLSYVLVFVRVFLLREMIGLPLKDYTSQITKMTIAFTTILFFSYRNIFDMAGNFIELCLWSLGIDVILLVVYLLFIFDSEDIKLFIRIIRRK